MGSIVYLDGFEEYDPSTEAFAWGWNGNFASTPGTPPRHGVGQYAYVGNQSRTRTVDSDTRYSVGFAFFVNTGIDNGCDHLSFMEGSTVHGTIRRLGSLISALGPSSSVLGTNSDIPLALYQWHHIEVDYTVSDTAGAVEVRLDGHTIIGPLTNLDTQNGGTGIIDTIRFYSPTGSGWGIDDIVITKGGGFHGDCRVITQYPVADGTNDAWTRNELPRFVAAGTQVMGTDAIVPTWPTHEVGDIGLLFVESAGGEAVSLSSTAGFAEVANSPQATGSGTAGTRLTVYWCRATSTSMSAPTVADPGDHVYARILTFRGCLESGDPWDVTGGGVKASASTSLTATGVTTTQANDLVVVAASWDIDNSGPVFTSWTNTNLTGLTEVADAGGTLGNGGGIGVAVGLKSTAGATGDTTATLTSAINSFLTIALKSGTEKFSSLDDKDDTTYISASSAGDRQTFVFPDVGVVGTVRAVELVHVSSKEDAGETRAVTTVIRRSSTNYDTANPSTLSTSYVPLITIHETDPSTSSAWTVAGIDAGEYGIKLDT